MEKELKKEDSIEKSEEITKTNDQEKITKPKDDKNHLNKKTKIIIGVGLILLIIILLGVVVLGKDKTTKTNTANNKPVTTVKKSPTKKPVTPVKEKVAIDCGALTLFSNKDVGMAFCYPTAWGTASVTDAKVAPADTGHRESIKFSANPAFAVGGTSEDWTTTVGRDVGCLEPNNVVPALSTYNTEWNGIIGSGMAVEYAKRSLPSSVGGYDITEEVSNILSSGVCAQGHKVINGSRYKTAFAGYSKDFSSAAGITTPKAHIDNPNVLFSETERAQFDALLNSIIAF